MDFSDMFSKLESISSGGQDISHSSSSEMKPNVIGNPVDPGRRKNLSSNSNSNTFGTKANSTRKPIGHDRRNYSSAKAFAASGMSTVTPLKPSMAKKQIGGCKSLTNDNVSGSSTESMKSQKSLQDENSKSKKLNFIFGFRKINSMLKENDCDEILLYIFKNADIFELLLKEELRQDLLVLLVKLIVKTMDTAFPESKVNLYLMIYENEKFMNYLASYITGLADSVINQKQLQAHYELLDGLHVFFKDFINLLPNKPVDIIEKVVIRTKMVLGELVCIDTKFEVLLNNYKELKDQIVLVKERNSMESEKVLRKKHEQAPPDDFRDISIFPTAQDLKERNFLRENRVEGSYKDVHDYLDVQFRLLREDFIDPLRVGINLYKESVVPSNQSDKKRRNFNIRIYRDVTFTGIKYDKNRMGQVLFTIQLDKKHTSKIRWEYSKRLLFNSLCLFSVDNFETFLLATVADRDMKYLKDGELSVVLVGENSFGSDLFNMKFVMAESSAFFDPVYQTLNTLQTLPTDSLPMENYILVKDVAQRRPVYLKNKSTIVIKGETIFIDDDMSWRNCLNVGFNESQCDALKASIRSEFCVIQGPPGTGKTYLGINLVKTLLENIKFNSPILMVCYTNHALDQFLEGLIPVTNNIVRIGSQSKNEALNQFNFKNLRMATRHTRIKNPELDKMRAEMTKCLENLKSWNNVINGIQHCIGIINVLEFKHKCKLNGINKLESGEDLLEWLLGDDYQCLKTVKSLYYSKVDEKIKKASGSGLNLGKEKIKKPSNSGLNEDSESDDEDNIKRKALLDELDVYEELEEIEYKNEVPYLLTINHLELLLNNMQNYLFQLNSSKASDFLIKDLTYEINLVIDIVKDISRNLIASNFNLPTNCDFLYKSNLWNLPIDKRWLLYHFWIKLIKQEYSSLINNEHTKYCKNQEAFNECRSLEDYSTIQDLNPKILGLTTTGAARYHKLLCAVKPAVIIVEEAAEVLEAHIIVSLTKSCKHLILIGDHKQLRPNPSTFKLAKDYHLDISFFERMIRNGVGCFTLNVQHRMKPNIASLISPLIYPNLQNHHSVNNFPPVLGVLKNLYFINHKELEEKGDDLEGSHRNNHEAKFLIALCRYLLLQGYKPEDITILTTYSGQQFYLRDLKKNESLLKQVRMTVVDNYQGEECKIILLSLVRSNNEESIGFLATENRICVALSRAKHGLYIIGNMDLLKSKSDKWMSIYNTLEKDEAIGETLPLICQIHKVITHVKNAKDFNKVVEGGCSRLCEVMMLCGHTCTSICHPLDREKHLTYKCTQPCNRDICDVDGHVCPFKCYEPCKPCEVQVKKSLECHHEATMPCCHNPKDYMCKVLVNDIKPDCKHDVQRPCHKNVMLVKCPVPCNIRLDCGHSCTRSCHVNDDPDHMEYKCWKDCTKPNTNCQFNHPCQRRCFEECKNCVVPVQRTLSCGHTHRIACSIPVETFNCERDCNKILACTHKCRKKCYEDCGGCQEKVEKIIPECGHTFRNAICSEPVNRSMCVRACERKLSCGHPCMGKCRSDCNSYKCKEMVPSLIQPMCGHPGLVFCSKRNEYMDPSDDLLLSYCREPCNKMLPCGDLCKGTCGLCMQGRIHQVCLEKCGNVLICGHTCNVPCREDCPPCKEKCLYKCKHSKCNRECGTPCVPCKEKCLWVCKHMKCEKLCGEECNREPCYEPCDKDLKCGHPCVGFCGEPCPPLCRVCNKDELTEIFFGNEADEDARFVFLQDCKHTVESEGLEQWLNIIPEEGKDQEIGIKGCPKCKTPITGTLRFSNASKKSFKQVQDIKRKIFGESHAIENLRKQIEKDHIPNLKRLFSGSPDFVRNQRDVSIVLEFIYKSVGGGKLSRKAYEKGGVGVKLFEFVTKFTESILNHVCRFHKDLINPPNFDNSLNYGSEFKEVHNFIQMRFNSLFRHLSKRSHLDSKINNFEIHQFQAEFKRFSKAIDLGMIMLETDRGYFKNSPEAMKTYNKIIGILKSTDIMSDQNSDLLENYLKQFKKELKVSSYVGEREKQLVFEAMGYGLRQGHWYQCPNGHYFVIGDCGGAVTTGRCIECKATVGGTSYHLAPGNIRI